MKELSIEQKAAAYDEAIKRARKLQENSNGMILKKWLWNIFPELKEGEDERIRKVIRGWIYTRPASFFDNGISKEEILAWLEKQGEQKSIDNLTQQEAMDVAVVKGFDKQKPADKVEPKFNFKVGQWIVATGKCVYLITKIDGFNVILVDVDGNEYVFDTSSLENAHLWTIQDAKDGDVLFTSSTASHETFIFKSIDEKGNAECYFAYDSEDGFREGKYHFIGRATNCKPATQKQRDLLFQKMHEAGYEWDAYKKELKKIEQKQVVIIPKFRVGDEIKTSNEESLTITKIDEKGYWSEDLFICNFDDADKWKLVEQKPAWSEEDEANLDYLIDFCNGYYNGNKPVLTESTARSLSNWLYRFKSCEIMPSTNKIDNEEAEKTIHLACEFIRHRMVSNGNIGGVDYAELIKRLKSLRPQKQWKPSEEHIYWLKWAINRMPDTEKANEAEAVLEDLLEQLKKL